MQFHRIHYLILGLLFSFSSCQHAQTTSHTDSNTTQTQQIKELFDIQGNKLSPLVLTEDEWRNRLNEKEFYVLRQAGTERSFTGDLLNNKNEGVYTCRGCSLPLFLSTSKFKSGTGWPSFYQPINDTHIGETKDQSYGMVRVEVECNRCHGHLGHVFNDGPKPTGLRYCINSVALDFMPIKIDEVALGKP